MNVGACLVREKRQESECENIFVIVIVMGMSMRGCTSERPDTSPSTTVVCVRIAQ